MMVNFSERYKTYKTAELLLIIDQAADYQPEAVEAVRAELATREITEADEQAKHTLLQEEQAERDGRVLSDARVNSAIVQVAKTTLNLIFPSKGLSRGTHIAICLIILDALYGAVWSIYYNGTGLVSAFSFNNPYPMTPETLWYIVYVLIVTAFAVVPMVLFRMGRRVGWIMLAGTTVFYMVSNHLDRIRNYIYGIEANIPSEYFLPPFWWVVGYVVYFLILIILLTLPGVRERFRITRQIASFTFAVPLVLAFALFLIGRAFFS